jgi:hypothetical protein
MLVHVRFRNRLIRFVMGKDVRWDDANVVVCKESVGLRNLISGHVAGGAVVCTHLAGRSRRAALRLSGRAMARKTLCVVGTDLTHQRLMRIMASDTGYADISGFPPAAALFQTIWLKAHGNE